MSEKVQGNARKILQLVTPFAILYAVHRKISFEAAVLFGIAMNSADLNEVRERMTE